MDEFDELEIETIAAAHYYDDDNHCLDEGESIDEYDSVCETNSARHVHYHQHSGGGCLIIVLTGVVFTIFAATHVILAV